MANWELLDWLVAGGAVAAIIAVAIALFKRSGKQTSGDQSVNVGRDAKGDISVGSRTIREKK